MITNRLSITSLIAIVGTIVFSGVGYYVLAFRGTPFMPWDIRALKTAASVVGGYDIFPTYHMQVLMLLLFLVTQLSTYVCEGERKWSLAGTNVIISMAVIVFYCVAIYGKLEATEFNYQDVYVNQGSIASFISYSRYSKVKKPKGYNEKVYDSLVDSIETKKCDTDKEVATNIIMIMNESLADFSAIDDGEVLTEEYLPFIHSLRGNDNVISGNLYMPVFGATTTNSEFEVLTGVSCAYYNSGTPYQTSISSSTESMISLLNAEAYTTEGFHPCWGANWNRDKVYDYFGFDKKQFLYGPLMIGDRTDDMLEFLRGKVTDRCNYEILQEDVENNGSKRFMFNVTMQNHGGYGALEGDWLENSFDLSRLGDFQDVERYLSLAQLSDEAFEELIQSYESVEEPTLICMFGDHMPALGDVFYEELYGASMDSLTSQELQKKYITPFVIWANYDIDEAEYDKLSANYLGALLLKTANLSLDEYSTYLLQVMEQYPVISTTGIYDKEGNFYTSIKDIEGDELIRNYEYLMYHRMMGAK